MKLRLGIVLVSAVLAAGCADEEDDGGTSDGATSGGSSGGSGMGSTGSEETATASSSATSVGAAESSSEGGESSTSGNGLLDCADLPCGANCGGPGGDPVVFTCDADGGCNLGGEDTCQSCAELGCGEPCAEALEVGFCDANDACDISLTEPPVCE